MSSVKVVSAVLAAAFDTDKVVVLDTSDGCGAKFQVWVGSAKFNGVSLLERHRMVNTALKEEMKTIHALSIKAWTPEQWEQRHAQVPQ